VIALAPSDMAQIEELVELRGADVFGSNGGRIGAVEQIWVDDVNGLPEWAEVSVGRLRGGTRYVPLRAADFEDGRVTVNYTGEEVERSPEIDPRTAGRDQGEALYRYYRQPLPAPPPPRVRNPFDRMTARWVPGTHDRIEEVLNRFPRAEPDAGPDAEPGATRRTRKKR
jgi:sporulation protein YlmC with PRC-barrel domain